MKITYRLATEQDYEKLIALRLRFFAEVQTTMSESTQEAITAQLADYLPRHLNVDLYACIAENDGTPVATAFLLIQEKPATPSSPLGKTGLVINVLTLPDYRRKGIAAKLLTTLIETGKQHHLAFIELAATDSGKPLYEKLGFQLHQSGHTEMKLLLPQS